ncbi:hypothetical protein [Metabacillus halosaccharovorans]|uniref:hypothetical protein n=1 Tax=Metabacillus halosaccharovorans TaxID=930124 RepID=UPI003735E085
MMDEKNRIIWFYTIDFLQTFSSVFYDHMPISIPLLRDFQKFVERHISRTVFKKRNIQLNLNIQSTCEPYLLKNIQFNKEGAYYLVRSDLYPLTSGIKHKCIYLAHHQNEYNKMLKIKQCRPLYYLNQLPEKELPINEAKKVNIQLNQIFHNKNTSAFLKNKLFITWMRNSVKKLLLYIRKVHWLFEKYSFSKTIYGSTINRHGALITTFAQSRKIETINFQHGIMGEIGHLPINADINLVWGKSHLDFLSAFGAPKEKMKIVPPYFPKSKKLITKIINTEPKLSNHSIKTNENRLPINILVALQPLSIDFNKRMIQNIESSSNKFAGKFHIHFKLHPDQDIKDFKNLVSSPNSYLYEHNTITIQELLSKCDLLITHSSAVAFEALILRKAAVFYSSQTNMYYLQGTPLFVKTNEEVYNLFSRLAISPSFLKDIASRISLKDDHTYYKSENYNIEQYIK